MKSYTLRAIRNLPNWAEFAIVVIVAFGYFVRNSILWLVQNIQSSGTPTDFWLGSTSAITGQHLRFLDLYEPTVLVALSSFLYLRGWTLRRVGAESLSLRDALIGLILAIIPMLVLFGAALIVALIEPKTLPAAIENAGPTDYVPVMTALLNCIINPIYEETFVCGYVVSALKRRTRAWQSISISVAIRLLYHLYLGTLGMAYTLLVGSVFALWYVRKSRLWPVVVAHAILDFVAVAPDIGA